MTIVKINIPKTADIQTAFRLPNEHWQEIVKWAKENNCSKSDVIRYIIAEFIKHSKI